jgi:hypothetical protein
VTIGNAVASIGAYAFTCCRALTGVTIPGNVTSIGAGAFAACGLNSVTIPGGVTNFEGVVSMAGDDGAFANCASLTSVAISNGVTRIGDYAFDGCSALTSVVIPESVTSIGDGAFGGCHSLTNVTIPGSVTRIGNEVFEGCGLTSIAIPGSVTSIGVRAFSYCNSLTSVIIPGGVTNIDGYAFADCSALISAYFLGNAPASLMGTAFDNVTVYHLPGTTGWDSVSLGVPILLWNPVIQASGANFGVRTNQFGFNIAWASGQTVVVEACTNLSNPVWTPVATNVLTSDTSYFCDPAWTNFPKRFYRLTAP